MQLTALKCQSETRRAVVPCEVEIPDGIDHVLESVAQHHTDCILAFSQVRRDIVLVEINQIVGI